MSGHATLKKISLIPLAMIGLVAAQLVHARRRPDLPVLTNQDPSGKWGASELPRLRVVALGDSSITAPGVTPLDNAWVRRVAIDLSVEWRVEVRSVAVGGARVSDVLTDQVHLVVDIEPDLTLIAVGANDAIRGTGITSFETGLRQILTSVSAASGVVVTLGVGDLGTIPRLPRTMAWALTRRARLVNDAMRRATEPFHNVYAVNPWETMTEFSSGDLGLWAADQFHASGEGHAIFYKGAIPTIRGALAAPK